MKPLPEQVTNRLRSYQPDLDGGYNYAQWRDVNRACTLWLAKRGLLDSWKITFGNKKEK